MHVSIQVPSPNFNDRWNCPSTPWPANSGLLHLDSGSYGSRRAKQLGKVRETRFVWALSATAQPSTQPKRRAHVWDRTRHIS